MNDTPQIERKWYKVNDLYFKAKNKKACNFNHFRRKCIASDTKWLNIINAEHCIDARSSLIRRFAPYIESQRIHLR